MEKRKQYKSLIRLKEKIDKRCSNTVICFLVIIYILILTLLILLFGYLKGYWDTIEPALLIFTVISVGNALFFDNKLSLAAVKYSIISKLKSKKYRKEKLDLLEIEKLKNELESYYNDL